MITRSLTKTNILNLPDEILFIILNDFSNLIKIQLKTVCKRFNNIIKIKHFTNPLKINGCFKNVNEILQDKNYYYILSEDYIIKINIFDNSQIITRKNKCYYNEYINICINENNILLLTKNTIEIISKKNLKTKSIYDLEKTPCCSSKNVIKLHNSHIYIIDHFYYFSNPPIYKLDLQGKIVKKTPNDINVNLYDFNYKNDIILCDNRKLYIKRKKILFTKQFNDRIDNLIVNKKTYDYYVLDRENYIYVFDKQNMSLYSFKIDDYYENLSYIGNYFVYINNEKNIVICDKWKEKIIKEKDIYYFFSCGKNILIIRNKEQIIIY